MKRINFLITTIPCLILLIICSSCGNSHSHSFSYNNDETNHWEECSCGEKSEKTPHNYGDWVVIKNETATEEGERERTCNTCGYKDKEKIYTNEIYTKGLAYELNNDRESYSVEGIGTALDSDIIVPNYYNNLPVTAIKEFAFEKTDINSVVIQSNIKTIGRSALSECLSLKNVTILGKINEIQSKTFYGCSNLINVVLPASLQIIGSSAFEGCSNICYIEIPENVEEIGENSFKDCLNLASIKMFSSVKKIDFKAFLSCEKLDSIYYKGTIEDWCNIKFESNIFSSTTSNHFYLENTDMIWEEVLNINISNTITEIGEYQFYGFNNLKSINLSNNITNIKKSAFGYCSSLQGIVIPDSVTSIGKAAFINCSNLHSISLPFTGESLSNSENTHFGYIFGADTFEKNSDYVPTKLKDVSIRGGYIKDDAFAMCMNIENLYILEGVTQIEKNAFLECYGLRKVQIPVYGISAIPNEKADSDDTLTINEIIISGGDSIPSNIFEYFINLEKIEIREGIEIIGDNAFANCSGLNTILLPKSLKKTGLKCFSGCSNLKNVYYAGNIESWCNIVFDEQWSSSNPMNFARHCYMKNNNGSWEEVTNIELPTTIDKIGTWQFYGFDQLKSIKIPANITKIDYGAFMNCYQLLEIYNFSSLNIQIGSEDNGSIGLNAKTIYDVLTDSSFFNSNGLVFFNKDENYTLTGYIGQEKDIELPKYINEKVYDIGAYAFEDSSFRSITIPNTIKKIGYRAFYKCSALDIVYYDGTIEDWCNISFDAQNSTSNPMNYADHIYMKDNFDNLQEIEEIEIPSTVTDIGDWQFFSFNNLKSIHIPSSVKKIGYGAFYYCSNLASVIIDNGLTEIGAYAFSNCINLFSILIPDSVLTIQKGAFNLCSNLRNVSIGNGIENIGEEAFFGCEKLKVVTIGSAIQTIGNRTFYNCFNLEEVTILGNLKSIGEETFYWCQKLTNINLPDSVEEIGSFAFYYCISLTKIHIPSSLVEIKDNVFNSCYNLNELILPTSVKTIGDSAFAFCHSIEKVDLGSVEYIGECAFMGCSNLEYAILPANGVLIGDDAFAYCKENFRFYYDERKDS